MKKKIIVLCLFVLVFIFALALCAGAQEYAVSSNAEFDSAFASAQDGDTIVITGNITSGMKFNKSLTYVLRADWQPVSAGGFAGGDIVVSVVADGGDYKLQPTGYDKNGWIQQYTDVSGAYVINLAGINGGTVTFDGTNATNPRVFWVGGAFDLTWNLLDGSRMSNFNLTSGNGESGARIIYAKTINMYDGSKICGNSIPSGSSAFITTTNLNIYGGEICHNYTKNTRNWGYNCGFIFVSGNICMFGGSIHHNITDVKMSKDFYGFICQYSGKSVAFFGGYIGENYQATTGNISAIFGVSSEAVTYCYYKNQEFGKAYKFTGAVLNANGEWVVAEDAQITESTLTKPGFTWKGHFGASDSVTAFFNSDTLVLNVEGESYYIPSYKAIDGFIEGVNLKDAWNNNQGQNRTYSISGGTYAVPSNPYWANAVGACGASFGADAVTKGGYYYAVEHIFAEDDRNCTTSESCALCGYGEAAKSHVIKESIAYAKGYILSGVYSYECVNEGCDACDTTKEASAIFVCLGYTRAEFGTYAIMQAFKIDNSALELYNRVCDNQIVDFGVVAGTQENLGTGAEVFEGGVAVSDQRIVTASIYATGCDVIEIKILGILGEADYTDTALYCCGYIITADGESSYITSTAEGGVAQTQTLEYSITFNKIS